MRRASLPVLAAILVAATLAHAGPKPEEIAAQRAQVAAAPWLALMDAGDYEKTWDESSKVFRASMTREKWMEASKGVREPLGKVVSRKLFSAKYADRIPGAPRGKYVIIQYDTVFEKKGMTAETVMPMLDPDGAWRVSGYFVK